MNSEAIEAMKAQMDEIKNLLNTAAQLNGQKESEEVLNHLVKMQAEINKMSNMAIDLIPLVVKNK